MLLLDTHVLIWHVSGDRRLSQGARRLIRQAIAERDAAVSSFTYWEIAMLHAKGRMSYIDDLLAWQEELTNQGIVEIPVNARISIRANFLEGLPNDPADRIIVATALEGHQLMTGDASILNWPGRLDRIDATVEAR